MGPADESKGPAVRPIPAVNAVIQSSVGKVLLTRRSALVRAPGFWCLPGGHLDGGEDWRTAIVREVHEEVGLEILELKLLGIYSDPFLTTSAEALPEGYRAQFVAACFLVTHFAGEIMPNSEIDQWGWFLPTELPTPMLQSHPVRILDAYRFKGEAFIR